ncbi:TlpA family protein disulfide reductase [Thermomonas sp. S9]|uniref:TlpA family protein disulfide reductase n=1 Tax=Thermomonas sp. S9 TaxID=2885203 RepID=UPI00216B320D|nr:TlpA disulfide reductase family protein [Thermomonas sp. S9]MCR6495367.1 TlpA family protein disulfide reductase [Thermomonas sp. S9]
MPSHRAVVAVALLAGLAGVAASLLLEPTLGIRLASTAFGQRVLEAALQARAPAPPAGLTIARTGAPLPAMTLRDVNDAEVDVPRAWAGRPTLVNLWATWCGPCLKEMPDLQAFARVQGRHGVRVVGIALDEAAAVRAFLPAHGITYPVLIDAPGPADAGVRLGNPAGVLPFSALVSADGRLLKTRIGPFADAADIAAWAADTTAR